MKATTKQLSIIVPVFNVESYLHKCVDSLLNQNLAAEDYEIILVDDGSLDDSSRIVDDYAQTHTNIRVIHQENQGLSGARNTGLDMAEGKYVQFVDSDDYLEPNVLGELVALAEKDDLDVLRFDYQNVNEHYEVFEPNKQHRAYVDYSSAVCDGSTFLVERMGYACYACQFLIRCSLLENCHFMPRILFEDTEWTPRMLMLAQRVASTERICYNYFMRQGSITKTTNSEKKRKAIADKMTIIHCYQENMESIDNPIWHKRMISGMVLGILSSVAEDFFEERKEYIKELKMMNVFPLELSNSTRSGLRKKKMINFSPNFYCLTLKCIR